MLRKASTWGESKGCFFEISSCRVRAMIAPWDTFTVDVKTNIVKQGGPQLKGSGSWDQGAGGEGRDGWLAGKGFKHVGVVNISSFLAFGPGAAEVEEVCALGAL